MTTKIVQNIEMAERSLEKSEFQKPKYEQLHSLVIDNIEYFRQRNGKFSRKFLEYFSQFLEHLNAVDIEIRDLSSIAHLYDFDSNTPGNGFRSFISVVDTFVEISMGLCSEITYERRRFNFAKKHYFGEVRAFTRLLGGLLALIRISQKVRLKNAPGILFSDCDSTFIKEITTDMENIDRTCFYGRLIAFQFDESLRKPLRFISLMVVSYSQFYYGSGGKIPRLCSALMGFCRYSQGTSKLSKRFLKVVRHSTVDFCQRFWNLQGLEFLDKLSKAVTDPMAVNKRLILPQESIQLNKDDGTIIDIPIPSSHTPITPVVCRLVCAHARDGQLDENETQESPHVVKPASPYLIIHIHGSGYISVSSTIHKVYLNDWAMKLDAPILSIYHSLAPEAPYPRPLEDCLYAYAWAIKNCRRLGSTGEKICLVGCSAGGDLVTTLTIKAIQLGIRIPDGIVAVCPANMTHCHPSPSVMMTLMDPLAPVEFVLACLEAYTGNPVKSDKRCLYDKRSLFLRAEEVNRNAGTDDPLKSPFLVTDDVLTQFPPMRIVSSHLDPVMDYLVMFSKRMKTLGKDIRLDLLGNLAHGFLNFALVSQPALEGSRLCIQRIKDILEMPSNNLT